MASRIDEATQIKKLRQEQLELERAITAEVDRRAAASTDGLSQARHRLGKVNEELAKTKATGGLSSLGKSIEGMLPSANTLVGMALSLHEGLTRTNREAVSLAVSYGRLSLTEAVKQQGEFRTAATRAAVAAGSDYATLAKKVTAVAEETNESQDEILAYARATQNISGGFDNALNRARALSREGKDMGLSFSEAVESFGTAMPQNQGIGSTLVSLRREAELLSTVGGPLAFQRQILSLGAALNGLSADKVKQVGAIFGGITKDLDPARAQEVQGRIAGTIKGKATEIKRDFGVDVLDKKTGELDPTKITEVIARLTKGASPARGEQILSRFFNDAQTGRVVANAQRRGALDKETIARIAGGEDAASTGEKFDDTEAGRAAAAEAATRRNSLKQGAEVLADKDKITKALADVDPANRNTVEHFADTAASMGVSSRAIARTIGGDSVAEKLQGATSAGLQLAGNPAAAQFLDQLDNASKAIRDASSRPIEIKVINGMAIPILAVREKKSTSGGGQ